jgi:hypothetical protein
MFIATNDENKSENQIHIPYLQMVSISAEAIISPLSSLTLKMNCWSS